MFLCLLCSAEATSPVLLSHSQGLNVPVPTPAPTPAPAPVPTPLAPSADEASGSASDAVHIERLQAFFAENRPDNVSKAAELYGKVGSRIWIGLEAKYPGKTARYTEVITTDAWNHHFVLRSALQLLRCWISGSGLARVVLARTRVLAIACYAGCGQSTHGRVRGDQPLR